MKKLIQLILLLMLMGSATGCATGPVRYKTLGRYKYATVEFTKRAHPAVKPVAVVSGVVVDTAIVALDTVATPVICIPVAAPYAFIGPCPGARDFRNHPIKETSLSVLIFPVWFPVMYPHCIYNSTYVSRDSVWFDSFYPWVYGNESSLFTDTPIMRRKKVPIPVNWETGYYQEERERLKKSNK